MKFRPQRAFTLVELLIVIAVVAVLASIAIPSMIHSRQSANETSAVATLHAITVAQESYLHRNSGQSYATLAQLHAAGLVDAVVRSGHKSGYTFTVSVAPGGFTATAEPDVNGGVRYFYMDASGIIRANEGAPATVASIPLP